MYETSCKLEKFRQFRGFSVMNPMILCSVVQNMLRGSLHVSDCHGQVEVIAELPCTLVAHFAGSQQLSDNETPCGACDPILGLTHLLIFNRTRVVLLEVVRNPSRLSR